MTDRAMLQSLSHDPHDPHGLMPATLPDHPRVLLTPARVERTRRNIETEAWARVGRDRLLEAAATELVIPPTWDNPSSPGADVAVKHALRNAIAAALTGEARHREEALRALRAVARSCRTWQVPGWQGQPAVDHLSIYVLRFFASAYDALQVEPLAAEDEALFRAALTECNSGLHVNPHRACGNHNTWNLVGQLTVASALGDMQGLHDVYYGCEEGGEFRYGLVHQIQHDLLADGLHWERTLGYHYYTLMALTELADLSANLGIDVWGLQVPALLESDGQDIHRDYGPAGMKSFKMAYDAPFYHMYPNREFPLLHDSGLANFRGVYIWGMVYDLAWQAYRDPKYAWLINVMERENPDRACPELPIQLHTWAEHFDLVRLEAKTYPGAEFSLGPDAAIGQTGRHENGCSLFPAHGSAILRHDATDEATNCAYVFFGPHSAGHQAPAALHLDLHFTGKRRTDASQLTGYDDPNYLTWGRTTIAHNTVTVDEKPMFPYGPDTESIWEADVWHDRVSDGALELFQSGPHIKAARASNENVYPGVWLDRTVILAGDFVLDVYRVSSDTAHQYDWAMHVLGRPDLPSNAQPCDLGAARGYCHLAGALSWMPDRALELTWRDDEYSTTGRFILPPAAEVIVAEDPVPLDKHDYGEFVGPRPRTSFIARSHASSAVFVALWQDGAATPVTVQAVELDARGDVVLQTTRLGTSTTWLLPYATGQQITAT